MIFFIDINLERRGWCPSTKHENFLDVIFRSISFDQSFEITVQNNTRIEYIGIIIYKIVCCAL